MSDCWHIETVNDARCKGIEMITISRDDIDHLTEGGQLLAVINDVAIIISLKSEEIK